MSDTVASARAPGVPEEVTDHRAEEKADCKREQRVAPRPCLSPVANRSLAAASDENAIGHKKRQGQAENDDADLEQAQVCAGVRYLGIQNHRPMRKENVAVPSKASRGLAAAAHHT